MVIYTETAPKLIIMISGVHNLP